VEDPRFFRKVFGYVPRARVFVTLRVRKVREIAYGRRRVVLA
jgi:hypothetical protein